MPRANLSLDRILKMHLKIIELGSGGAHLLSQHFRDRDRGIFDFEDS